MSRCNSGCACACPVCAAAYCSVIPGYTFTLHKDSTGNNIVPARTTVSTPQLASLCDATPGCAGFTSRGATYNEAWLKTAIKSPLDPWTGSQPGPCDGTFTKQPSGWGYGSSSSAPRHAQRGRWCHLLRGCGQAGEGRRACSPCCAAVDLPACTAEPGQTFCSYCSPEGKRAICLLTGTTCKASQLPLGGGAAAAGAVAGQGSVASAAMPRRLQIGGKAVRPCTEWPTAGNATLDSCPQITLAGGAEQFYLSVQSPQPPSATDNECAGRWRHCGGWAPACLHTGGLLHEHATECPPIAPPPARLQRPAPAPRPSHLRARSTR